MSLMHDGERCVSKHFSDKYDKSWHPYFINCVVTLVNLCFLTSLPYSVTANIGWSSSWRRLQHVLSVAIFRLPRRLQGVFKTSWRRLAKTSWKTKKLLHLTRLQDIFKTSWRHVLKTFWRHVLKTSSRRLVEKQKVYWGYLYLANLNVYLTNLYFPNLYLTKLRQIRNALIWTQ